MWLKLCMYIYLYTQPESTLNIHWKNWCWSSNTLATWCEVLTHWERLWFWERLRAWGERGDRRWNGWMSSSTQWTWVCANSRTYWRTGYLGVLQCLWSQRVRHNLATEQQQWDLSNYYNKSCCVPPKQFKGSSERASLVVQTVKVDTCNAGDLGSIPGSGRSLGEGNGYPL